MQRCKSVILRQRPRRNGTISLYLHFYPGYRDPESLQIKTKKSLDLYIIANPQTKAQKEYNAVILEKAEAIRCQVYMEIVNERYGFFSKQKGEMNFVEYFENLSKKNHIKWQYTFKHFAKFIHGDCTFDEINVDLCRKFMEYLEKDATRLSSAKIPLNKNTAADYWIVFRNALRHAYRDHYINENIVDRLDYIKWVPTIKESLTLDEVRDLYNTPCVVPVMRKAALFSCLTGIRRSDIINMTWESIRTYADGGKYVDFICQKTKVKTMVPLSNETLAIIEYTGNHNPKDKIFEGFTKEVNNKELKDWILDAGISKHITFHCFRHTYASLQLELGTDIYTVQHLLAHKNVATTQIYACHADPKIREAADRIKLTDVKQENFEMSLGVAELETKSQTTEKPRKQVTQKRQQKH